MNITWTANCPTGVPADAQVVRELTAAVQELTLVVQGLTGVLIEDREQDQMIDVTTADDGQIHLPAAHRYMDGTTG
ncbi:hypothetical protein ARC78_15255 [Stenotrophomonas pictorum JCM 9942]|uniref:Uncharacterized protein n=1 Tax=Stenotrophomonas pictorum JCM 9942 TaxID=1236960 RepID=A0A0R0A0T0_9GAMM|nr:hypothetical protein [Stenotrophomonas pictorum]KRG38832.1 hypothetical protein ARC78_15255 [Stenotrophomonas pictorum JCM 9942]